MARERSRRANLPPVQENIDKLETMINGGNYYGAQQMYKSISSRYSSAQRYSEALDLLHSGACLQLKNAQVTCGSELAVLFVDTLVKGKFLMMTITSIPVPHRLDDLGDDEEVQQLTEAIGAAKIRVECCSSFLKAAIRWSAEFGAHKNGSPRLHAMLAEYLFSESPEADMTRISYHFVRGDDPTQFASTLVNFMGKCFPGEDDLAIARAILMYLAMGNLRDANCLMDELKKQVESKKLDLPKSNLMQFITYLLPTLQRDAFPLFNMLRVSYKTSIDREPVFNELLDEIAEKLFGIQRRNPLQGMFGDIFKMMQ